MKIDPPPLQSDIWRQNFEMKIATKFDNFRDRVEILLLRFKVSSLLFFFFFFSSSPSFRLVIYRYSFFFFDDKYTRSDTRESRSERCFGFCKFCNSEVKD